MARAETDIRRARDGRDSEARHKRERTSSADQHDEHADAPASARKSVFARLGGASQPSRERRERRDSDVSNRGRRDDPGRRGANDSQLGKRHADEDRTRARSVAPSEKRQRRNSATTASKGDGDDGTRANEPEEGDPAAEEKKKRAVAPYAQKDGMARNRRMFGALMGHLGKAKAMIEQDSSKLQRQNSRQLEAERKEKEQSRALEARAKQRATIARLEKMLARLDGDCQEQLTRVKQKHAQHTKQSRAQSRFLLTVASPPIYYLPKKHTKDTEDLVAASMEAQEAKAQIAARAHEKKLHEIEAEFATKKEQYQQQLDEAKNESIESATEASVDQDGTKETQAELPANEDASMGKEEPDGNQDMEEGPAVKAKHRGDPSPRAASPRNSSLQMTSPQRTAGEDDAMVSDDDSESHSPRTATASPEPSPRTTGELADQADDKVMEHADAATPEPTPAISGSDEPATEAVASLPDAVAASSSPVSGPDPPTGAPPSNASDEMVTTPAKQKIDVSKLRVTDLRQELKSRGLDIKGLKAALVKRLEDAMAQEDNAS